MINAAGVIREQLSDVSTGKLTWDNSWNVEWESGYEITDSGWNIEFKIPLSTMEFDNTNEKSWGLQLTRVADGVGETKAKD